MQDLQAQEDFLMGDLPAPGGIVEVEELVDYVEYVVFDNTNNTMETRRVSRKEMEKCTSCYYETKNRYFDHPATMNRFLVMKCAATKPGNYREKTFISFCRPTLLNRRLSCARSITLTPVNGNITTD